MSFLISCLQLCFGGGQEDPPPKPEIIDEVKKNDAQPVGVLQPSIPKTSVEVKSSLDDPKRKKIEIKENKNEKLADFHSSFEKENIPSGSASFQTIQPELHPQSDQTLDVEEQGQQEWTTVPSHKKNQHHSKPAKTDAHPHAQVKSEHGTESHIQPHTSWSQVVHPESQDPIHSKTQNQSQQHHTSWAQAVQSGLESQTETPSVHVDHVSHSTLSETVATAAVVGEDVRPSSDEINNVSLACSKLWLLDTNRLRPGIDYELDLQRGKKVHYSEDAAPNPLFKSVNQRVFSNPTFSSFCTLLNNFNPDESVSEVVTEKERKEQRVFIEAIYLTRPIQYLHKYLYTKGICSKDTSEFKSLLLNLWFELYNRGHGRNSSCAFEHVFVGEMKKGENGEEEVSGFHNWIHMYLEESKGRFDYRGYILPRNRYSALPEEHHQVLTLQFQWNSILKKVSTSFIGVSPEFELALYTLCFFSRQELTEIHLGDEGYQVSIRVYRFGEHKLSTAFPITES